MSREHGWKGERYYLFVAGGTVNLMNMSAMNLVEVEAGRLSRMRRVWNSLCGESARERMRQIKELLSNCKGHFEIG